MSNPRVAFRSAPVFAALGDRTRLELVSRLSGGESQSIVQLCEGIDITRQGVTKHLRVLSEAGIVSCRRTGRETRYTLQPDSLRQAKDDLVRASAQWDAAIERLRAIVEE